MATELGTIGYQGHDSESFIYLLQKMNARVLVDVRQSARSRNRTFGKTALESTLADAGIEYVHMPELGVEPELRALLKETGDFEAYRKEYLRRLGDVTESLDTLYNLVVGSACCLMCMEHEPEKCHRSVLAERVCSMNGESISILHL